MCWHYRYELDQKPQAFRKTRESRIQIEQPCGPSITRPDRLARTDCGHAATTKRFKTISE